MDIVGKIGAICKILIFVVKFHLGTKPQPKSLYHRFIKSCMNALYVSKLNLALSRLHTLLKVTVEREITCDQSRNDDLQLIMIFDKKINIIKMTR